MSSFKRADWVTCEGLPSHVGCVQRVARDGSWADVNWGSHTKRMQTKYLQVQHTLQIGGGWSVTDETRRRELEQTSPPFDPPELVSDETRPYLYGDF